MLEANPSIWDIFGKKLPEKRLQKPTPREQHVSMDHDPKFMHTMESINSEIQSRLTGIARKQLLGEKLATEDVALLEISERWKELTRK